jgi:hypothetical protein
MKVRRIIVSVFLTYAVLEALLFLLGFRLREKNHYSIDATPEFVMLQDSELGFRLNPGRFEVTINHGLHYSCTHNEDGFRVTGDTASDVQLPEIHLYGCSFTYGMGLSDSLTFPHLVQDEFSAYEILNFGVPSYGTLHALQLLKKNILESKKPEAVVLCHAHIHERRNTMSLRQQCEANDAFQIAKLPARKAFANAAFPFVKDSTLAVSHVRFDELAEYWWLSRYSITAAAFEQVRFNTDPQSQKRVLLTKQLIAAIDAICRDQGIPFVVVCLIEYPGNSQLVSELRDLGIAARDISVNTASEHFNLLPFDGHPNEKANREFADGIIQVLEANVGLEPGSEQ